MTEDPRKILYAFIPVCEELCFDHELYSALFESGTKTLQLYEKTAPHAFLRINRILIGRLLIEFCRVTDPAMSMGKPNLTTNYFIERVSWPDEVLQKLKSVNDRMMKFRDPIVEARNKRLAHIDLRAQTVDLQDMGAFPKGDDRKFLADLGEFVDIAHDHLLGGPRPIDGGSSDAANLIRGLEKAQLFDACGKCTERDRIKAVLDFER